MYKLNKFIEECVSEHNIRRRAHNVLPLKHSRALDKTAQDWADALISEEGIKNSPISSHGEVGESISVRTSTGSEVDIGSKFNATCITLIGQELVAQWYSDNKNYNYETGKGPAGNFTQLVWNNTTEVGLGKAQAFGKCVVVAHYRPPGNIIGRYLENVFPPKNEVDVTKSSDYNVSKTHVSERVTYEDGKKFNVRKEISETTDESRKIRRCINQVYSDAEDVSSRKISCDPQDFIKSIVEAHNECRKKHDSSPLVHDSHLTNLAQQWADHLLKQSHLSNSGYTYKGLRLGENIGSRWSNGPTDYSCQELIDHWYHENEKYKFDAEAESIQGIGNFTQMVWAESDRIGVGRAENPWVDGSMSKKSYKIIVVCLYYPPGNIKGQFRKNVKRARGV